ncbi:MAG: DUF3089 domain-containing protein [Actinobacteria bacterium]|nr:DUF3089 domain-containing protein [Actinomycetota bacterium]
MRARSTLVAALVLITAVVGTVPARAGSDASSAPETVWICHPDVADNPCLGDLNATVVFADGTTEIERATPARKPDIDCFYVYPTVSGQPSTNADLSIDPEIAAIAELQASRFSQVCRVFAPVYRQVTLSGLFGSGDRAGAFALAYGDVVAAWDEYLRTENDGRGVVLIGHSQGSGMLRQLISNEIEDTRARRRLVVSALLLGSDITVERGTVSGGAFTHLPGCTSPKQTGCVVAYSSFDATPPANTLFGTVAGFGMPDQPGLEVLCTNPANLRGGSGPLAPYFRTTPFPGVFAALGSTPDADTPWVTYPDRYDAACEHAGVATWLQVDAVETAGDARPVVAPTIGDAYGLHLVDVQLALGNLVDLVRAQARAYERASR